jgi:hypothetical protein
MWFTDTPWPPIFICCVAAAVCGIVWFSTQRGKYLLFAFGFLFLSGLIFGLERMVVTEAERIEADVYTLTSAFQQKDLEKTLSFFSDENKTDRDLVRMAMGLVTVHDDLRVSNVIVTVNEEDSLATSHFRANASVTMKGYGEAGWRPSRWEFTWRREEGEWRITKIRRLNPIRDETMEPLEKRVE